MIIGEENHQLQHPCRAVVRLWIAPPSCTLLGILCFDLNSRIKLAKHDLRTRQCLEVVVMIIAASRYLCRNFGNIIHLAVFAVPIFLLLLLLFCPCFCVHMMLIVKFRDAFNSLLRSQCLWMFFNWSDRTVILFVSMCRLAPVETHTKVWRVYIWNCCASWISLWILKVSIRGNTSGKCEWWEASTGTIPTAHSLFWFSPLGRIAIYPLLKKKIFFFFYENNWHTHTPLDILCCINHHYIFLPPTTMAPILCDPMKEPY